VLVTALDQKTNESIDGLTAGDLRAKFKGHEVPILSSGPAPTNRRFVFVLDRSGSITRTTSSWGKPYHPDQLARQALDEAVAEIPKSDMVAFLAFTGPSFTRTEFMDPASARAKVPQILAWEPNTQKQGLRTPLWDNIDAALRMLSPQEPGDAIVVETDGEDNSSKLQTDQIRSKLLEAHTPILAILLTNPYAPRPEGGADPAVFLELAKEVGGAVAPIGTAWRSFGFRIDAPLHPNRLISQLSYQYDLTLEHSPTQKPERWDLSARSKQTAAGLNLLYPHYLPACAGNK